MKHERRNSGVRPAAILAVLVLAFMLVMSAITAQAQTTTEPTDIVTEMPTTPVDPVDPTDPGPTDPVEPVDPVDPADPVDPVDPTEPPVDPTSPDPDPIPLANLFRTQALDTGDIPPVLNALNPGEAPINSSPPTLVGSSVVGSNLTCTSGHWTPGTLPITTYTFTWLRDGSAFSSETTAGTQASYETTLADVEHSINCQVTANVTGGSSAPAMASRTVGVVRAATSSVPPSVTGTGKVGDALSCLTGTWDAHGSPIQGYQFGWTRDGVPIASNWIGQGTSSYTPVLADVGHQISCAVSAQNDAGSSGVVFGSNSVLVYTIPINTIPPTVSGTGGSGEDVFCSVGNWNDSSSAISGYEYRWRLDGTLVPGWDSTTFVPTDADAKKIISCDVRASNAAGPGEWTPSSNTIKAYAEPLLLEPPEISSNAMVGRASTCTAGRWHANGSPITGYQYVFLIDDTPIVGAATTSFSGAASFTPTADLSEHKLGCRVSAVNAAGAGEPADSRFDSPVIDVPAVMTPPTVIGSGEIGETLSCTSGGWDSNGARVESFRYEWVSGGNPLSGQTGTAYTPSDADAGTSIRCRVFAANRAGESNPAPSSNAADVPVPPAEPDDEVVPPPPPPPPPPEPDPDPDPIDKGGDEKKVTPVKPDSPIEDLIPSLPPAEAVIATAPIETVSASGEGTDEGRPALTSRLPRPSDIQIGLPEVAGGGLIALLLGALIGLPVAIFNETAEKNHSTISRWMSGPKRLFAPLIAAVPSVSAASATLFTSILISFGLFLCLNPDFPKSLIAPPYLLGMFIGVGVVAVVYFFTWTIFMQRNLPEVKGKWTLYPPFIAIAAIVVLISRVAHFVPGLILGTIAEYEPDQKMSTRDAGRRVLWTFGTLFVLGIVAWFIWIPFGNRAAEPGAGFGWQMMDAALAVIVLASMESVVFGLIPAKFMDGDELRNWSKTWWALLWGGGLLWFVIVILRPALSLYGDYERGSVSSLGLIFLGLTLFSMALWGYFRWRENNHGDGLPHEPEAPAVAGGEGGPVR